MKRCLPGLIILLSLLAMPAQGQDSAVAVKAYERGDYAAALDVWRPLAERGDGDAQASLGLLYARGQGVGQDYAEAIKWFRLSATQGYAIAQNNLGVIYRNGYGVRQDYAMAAMFFRLSAAQGYALAQNSLAAMYEDGEGIRRDYVEAYMWYSLAASQGHTGALQARHALAQKITVRQIQRAAARALELQAHPERRDAVARPKPSDPAGTPLPRVVTANTPIEVAAEIPEPPVAPRPVAISPTNAGSAAWRVQLAALRSRNETEAAWTTLRQANQDVLDGLELHVQLAELSEGTFYRLQAGPLADRASAASLCDTLKTRQQDCLIVTP